MEHQAINYEINVYLVLKTQETIINWSSLWQKVFIYILIQCFVKNQEKLRISIQCKIIDYFLGHLTRIRSVHESATEPGRSECNLQKRLKWLPEFLFYQLFQGTLRKNYHAQFKFRVLRFTAREREIIAFNWDDATEDNRHVE